MSTSLLSAISCPTVAPDPKTRFAVPLGSPISSNTSNRAIEERGVFELGLNTILFPAAKAGAIFHIAIKNG